MEEGERNFMLEMMMMNFDANCTMIFNWSVHQRSRRHAHFNQIVNSFSTVVTHAFIVVVFIIIIIIGASTYAWLLHIFVVDQLISSNVHMDW